MKPELERQMQTEEAIYGWMRTVYMRTYDTEQEKERAQTEHNFVWWLHVVGNDNTALKIVHNPALLKADETLNALILAHNQEPAVLKLEKDMHEYEKTHPEGTAATIWMQNELATQRIQTEPWLTRLRTLTIDDRPWVRTA